MSSSSRSNKRFGKALVVLTVAMSTAVVFACGGDDENSGSSSGKSSSSSSSGGGGGDAKGFFTAKVYQPLAESCNQCHQTGKSGAPVFLGVGAEASYTAIEGFPGLLAAPNFSPLIQKGIHSGPALTGAQNEVVTEWLKLEVVQRKLGADPGTPKNLRAAFKAFGDCMDYARWKELKLHTIASTQADGNAGQCQSCHNYGQGSLWLAGGENPAQEADNAVTFLKMKQFPYVQRLVVGRVTQDGAFEGIESSRRLVDKGTEAQQLQANSHPRFALSSDLVAALNSYVLETISNVQANRCTGASAPDAGSYDAAAVIPK